jgi:hypothetical protein
MVTVGLFIKTGDIFQRIELFDDEKISITSSIQNISDISKVFTDFSQTFTVPASNKNNEIFKYWYENSLDNGFDARKRAESYIELDTINFRIGKLQLESVDLKNNKPNGYKLTFFGNLISLKDTFNGLLMKDLNAGTFDFAYSDSIVRTKLTTQTSSDIKFPLISSLRPWNYGGADANDISLVANTIAFGELFPAIRLRAIFDLIAAKFNITFAGFDSVTGFNPNTGFIKQDARFLNAYLLLKNSEVFKVNGQPLKIDYQSGNVGNFGFSFNLTTDILTLTNFNEDAVNRNVVLNVSNSVAGVPYSLLVYRNGILINTLNEISINGSIETLVFSFVGSAGSTDSYEFYIVADAPLTFTSFATFNTTWRVDGTPDNATSLVNQSTAQTTTSVIDVASYFPDLKIEDFFSGILKMFNLTCFSNVAGVFIVEQIETFYAQGKTINIDKYIISDATNIERTKPFNVINFKYQKSESLLSTAFLSNNRLDYGDLKAEFDVDGSEFAITLPFENPLFSGVTTNLSAGFLFKNDTRAYIPKPIVLYDYGTLQTVSPFFINGTSTTTYNAFGSESLIGTETFSLNFGQEQSPMTNNLLTNTLFSEYYSTYLNNIFNIKARIFKINAVFPVSILTSIKLNDRIVIRDKRYTINSIETDLSTKEVSLELITDFRELTTYIPPPLQDADYLAADYSTDYNV